MSILTVIGGAIASAAKWVAAGFKSLKTDGSKIAVSILEVYKAGVANGIVPSLAAIIDSVSGTHLGTDAVSMLNVEVPRLLAGSLLIEGLPDNPTAAQIETFENAAYTAITGLPATSKSRFYSTFTADVYGAIHDFANPTIPLTYAEKMADVEKAFQDLQKAIANEAADKANEATNTD